MLTPEEYIRINAERNKERQRKYDPITGEGCDSCERVSFSALEIGWYDYQVPFDCYEEKIFQDLRECGFSIRTYLHRLGLRYTRINLEEVKREIIRARCKHDFEFCAASFFYIKDKNPLNLKPILFRLNRGQRRLLKLIYKYDKAGQPVRIIICKRRQVGFSTLVQLYMAWKQLFVLHMAVLQVVAHVENQARIIRGMYSRMIKMLPPWLLGLPDDTKLKLSPFEKSSKTLIIHEIGCRMSVGSSEKPDNLAGDDVSMVHFSEVGLFKSSPNIKPEQLIQTIQSGIAYAPNTYIFYESTARGVGNFFHTEWLRAESGESDNDPFFSAWFDGDDHVLPIDNYYEFIASMTDYERWMFEQGATLENIAWYRKASKGQKDKWRWKSDQPTTAVEAFQSTGHRLYPQDDVMRLRRGCIEPKIIGDVYGDKTFGEEALNNIIFRAEPGGPLKIWFEPDKSPDKQCNDRYVVIVDIGGTSDHSDRSVICVIDRYDMTFGGVPIVVAEWCGHIDHYLLAWKAVQIATAYDNALLVIESNTLETEQTEGDHFEYVLDEIAYHYDNLYCRVDAEKIEAGFEPKWGFHTNKSTKRMVCDHQKKALRENMYIETCKEAVDEHDWMEIKKNGAIGAVEGQHDDRHITRAIGVWVCYDYLNAPRRVEPRTKKEKSLNKVYGESTI